MVCHSKHLVLAVGVLLAACADEPTPDNGSARLRNTAAGRAAPDDGGGLHAAVRSDAAARRERTSRDAESTSSRREAPESADASASTDASVSEEPLDAAASATDAAWSDAAPVAQDATAPRDAGSAEPTDGATSCGTAALEQSDGEHACMHAESGPFAMLQLAETAQTAPDASRAHTAFQLNWPADDPSHGFLRVRPPRAATHVIFSAGAEIIEVAGANENLTATSVSTTYCDRLPSAAVVELKGGEWSVIRLARMGDGESLVVIEQLTAETGGACGCEEDAGCGAEEPPPRECRSSGPCRLDSDCCEFCHDGDHCH